MGLFRPSRQESDPGSRTVVAVPWSFLRLLGLLLLPLASVSCTKDSGTGETPMQPEEIADIFAPELIDLSVSDIRNDQIELSWLSPHDEPEGKTVDRYDLRRHTQPITPAVWDSAETLPFGVSPKPEGSVETFVDRNVSALTTYHYAIRSFDAAGNASLISGSVVAAPTCRPKLLDFTEDQDLCPDHIYPIRWEAPPCVEGFQLELHHEDQLCYYISGILSPDTRSFDWRAVRCAHDQTDHSIVLRTTDGQWVRGGMLNLVDPCAIEIDPPAEGCEGEVMTLEWVTGPCCGDSVRIELEAEGSGTRSTVTSSHPNDGRFEWVLERFEGLDRWAFVVLTDLDTHRVFRKRVYIERPDCAFEVTRPKKFEAYIPGTAIQVEWQGTCCSEFVDLILLHNTLPCRTIAEAIPNDGSFLWTDTEGCEDQDFGYSIRVQGVAETSGRSETFSISDQCVILPAAYETRLFEGYPTPIRWSTNGVCESVNIDLFRGVIHCTTIAENAPNDGVFEWTPSLCPSGPRDAIYRIKIYSPETPTASYLTPEFTIVPYTFVLQAGGSGDYRTIADALEVSRSGDIVLEDGIYTGVENTSFDFDGDLHLRSASGDPTSCILDGGGGPGPRLGGRTITIEGVQFRNFNHESWSDRPGIALHIERRAHPDNFVTLDRCIFRQNGGGGWVSVVRLNPGSMISRCIFSENGFYDVGSVLAYTSSAAAGVATSPSAFRGDSRDTVTQCTFHANRVVEATIRDAESLRIEDVLFSGNLGYPISGRLPAFVGCTNSTGDVRFDWTGLIAQFDGKNGNISQDPRFCDPTSVQLQVRPDSPNLPDNNSCNRLIGASDACSTNR